MWVQDQNRLFTFLSNDYEAKFRQIAFSESVRISHGQHLPPKFFFSICFYFMRPAWDVMGYLILFMQISLHRSVFRNLKQLSYSTFLILILRKIFACPSGKLSTEFTSPIAKSTSPGLSDMTFFARWSILSYPVFYEDSLIIFCVHSKTFFLQILWWNSGADWICFVLKPTSECVSFSYELWLAQTFSVAEWNFISSSLSYSVLFLAY